MKIFSVFEKMLKYLEELFPSSHIKNLQKDPDSQVTLFEIGPCNRENNTLLSAYDVFTNPTLKKMLNKEDVLLIKSIAYTEGDIFLKEKLFEVKGKELYHLFSIITDESWQLEISEIEKNPDIISRLNIKYFNRVLSFE